MGPRPEHLVHRPAGLAPDALFKQHLNDPWAAGRRAFDPRHGDPSPGGGGHRASHAGGRTGRHRDAERGDERSGGDSHRHTRGASPGGGMSGVPVSEGGVFDHGGTYMHPWPALRAALPRLVLLRQADRPGRLRPLPDRRLRRPKELIYRAGDISCFQPVPLRARPRPPICPMPPTRASYAVCSLADATRGVEGIEPGQTRLPADRQPPPVAPTTTRTAATATRKRPIRTTGRRFESSAPCRWRRTPTSRSLPTRRSISSFLDANGMELRRMRSFISFHPGEHQVRGCHETRAGSADPGDRFPWRRCGPGRIPRSAPWGQRPLSFLRDIQPVFDRHCAGATVA